MDWQFELLIYGDMFSGKTKELTRKLAYLRYGLGLNVLAFKHVLDLNRYEEQAVHENRSFAGLPAVPCVLTSYDEDVKFPAWGIEDVRVILQVLEVSAPDWVGIDEGQFFDPLHLIEVIKKLEKGGVRCIVAQLDQDFRGKPFGAFNELFAHARHRQLMMAFCAKCHRVATRSQRLLNGYPAYDDDPVIKVGAEELYLAACERCHVVPQRGEQRELWFP